MSKAQGRAVCLKKGSQGQKGTRNVVLGEKLCFQALISGAELKRPSRAVPSRRRIRCPRSVPSVNADLLQGPCAPAAVPQDRLSLTPGIPALQIYL
uniref:Uncharacterized protein n=1 Tax=Catharus ustulatus TaxID=91951 RepID=A0A8C3TSK8_CATUS